ncbi:NAD kinase [Robertmurraya sp. Marseille-Q9965]
MSNRKNVYLFHKNDPKLLDQVRPLYERSEDYGFKIVNDFTKANIIVSIGSDSTFLQAVRKTGFREDVLYAGISTEEKLNIYCDFYIGDKGKIIEAVSNELIEVRRYPTIEVTIDNEFSFQCLSEFSVRSSIIKAIVLEIYIDELPFETFRGDGIIVSTPTGSTAYNKSAHGAIVDPLLPSIQVSELASYNNNQYRTLGSPFILSGDRELIIRVVQDGNDYPTMGMDNEALSIQHVENIRVKLTDKKIKTVKLKDNSFWEKVQRTFL